MSNIFDRANSILSGDEFEERPVPVEEFISSDKYMKLSPLSPLQLKCLKACTQIYKEETLVKLYGEVEGRKRFVQTFFEILLMFGKGGGKDHICTIACAYIVYQLLCLKDPAVYYGYDPGTTIDIINIAVNAQQAQRVFFNGFVEKISRSAWFAGKYDAKASIIEFDKKITVYSGHSEREGFEGYNTIAVFLDEISGFAQDSDGDLTKTADAIYRMYRASVTSRYPDFGKLVMLSFPRHGDDFITRRYNEVIIDKEVTEITEVVKVNTDLPDGTKGNEIEITWEEDEILRYKFARTFALRRPSWVMNPTKRLENYVMDFYENPNDAYARYACMPTNISGGFFKNHAAIDAAFAYDNGVDENGVWRATFLPKKDTNYFAHVDLAQKHDLCAVAVAHVDDWVAVDMPHIDYHDVWPVVVVDSIRWWTPTKEKSVDFDEVRNYILTYRLKGFNLKLVTFDRWNSFDTINILKEQGIEAETQSVKKQHYDDFLAVMYGERLRGPDIEEFRDELKALIEKNGKVDHPRSGVNDRAEAVCGAIRNAIANTPRPEGDAEIRVRTLSDIYKENRNPAPSGVIVAPKSNTPPPADIASFLERARML